MSEKYFFTLITTVKLLFNQTVSFGRRGIAPIFLKMY